MDKITIRTPDRTIELTEDEWHEVVMAITLDWTDSIAGTQRHELLDQVLRKVWGRS